MKYIVIITSFLLDGLISTLITTNAIFYPLLTLESLIVIYIYYNSNDKLNYLFITLVVGILYDIVYTNYLFLNASIFLLSGLLIVLIFKTYSYNFLSVSISSLILIIFYRIAVYIVLVISNYIDFSLYHLLVSIYSSIIVNIIYIFIVYFICIKLRKRRFR